MSVTQVLLLGVMLVGNVLAAVVLFLWWRERGGQAAPSEPPPPAPPPPEAPSAPAKPTDFPYRAREPLSADERALLDAVAAALGEGVRVWPKVAAAALLESAKNEPGYAERLAPLAFDLVLADAATGHPFATAMFTADAAKGELNQMCRAANVPLLVLEAKPPYDPAALREALGVETFELPGGAGGQP